jgi:hypothetical protein
MASAGGDAAQQGVALNALLQHQLASESGARARSRWLAALAVAAVFAAVAAAVWYFFLRRPPAPPSGGNTADCNPPCTGDTICIDGRCKSNRLECDTDAQCGECGHCVGGRCQQKEGCCGGVTCAKGQTCNAKTQTCEYVAGYCDRNRACPEGAACDLQKNVCIAEPPYGPASGKGCIEGFGTWNWELDESTNSGAWRCACVNTAIYRPDQECSPLASATACAAENLDPGVVMPASRVPAFSKYGWGDRTVVINPTTAGAAVPSPLAGSCPCKPGWAGGACTEDHTCNGRGTWNDTTGQCTCNTVGTCSAAAYGYPCTSWTQPDCANQCVVSGFQCDGSLPCCQPGASCQQGICNVW